MSANSFTEFCQLKGLSTETTNILSENGFSDTSDLALLSDADIDSNFTGLLLLAQRLRLKAVVKKLQSGDNSGQCETVPARQLIKRDYYTFPSEQKGEIRIVLVGKTGAGKSATANTIFGREEFLSEPGMFSQTFMCSAKGVVLDSQAVLVVDTPGVCDTDRDEQDVENEVTRCLALAVPGPHCLIMVFQYNRFTNEEFLAYLKIKVMFGENVKKHMILVVTRGDEIKKDYLEDIKKGDTTMKSVKILQTILRDVEDRCIVFNNKADPETKDRQVQALIKMVTDLMATHSPDYFRDEAVSRVDSEINEQARVLALKKQIPIEQAKEIALKEFNEETKSERLTELAKKAKQSSSHNVHHRYAASLTMYTLYGPRTYVKLCVPTTDNA